MASSSSSTVQPFFSNLLTPSFRSAGSDNIQEKKLIEPPRSFLSFQDYIDDYLEFDRLSIDDPVETLRHVATFITQLGHPELGNMLSDQIGTPPQEPLRHDIPLPHSHQPQRSTIEFARLLKDTLDEQLPKVRKFVSLRMFSPVDIIDQTKYWINFLVQCCILKSEGIEVDIHIINTDLSPPEIEAAIINPLINLSQKLNSLDFLNFTKKLAEKYASTKIPELDIMINTCKENPVVNTELFNKIKAENDNCTQEYLTKGNDYVDKISQAMLDNIENPYNLEPIIKIICAFLSEDSIVLNIAASLLKIYLTLLYQSWDALNYPFFSKKEADVFLDNIVLKTNPCERIQKLSNFLARLSRLSESQALITLLPPAKLRPTAIVTKATSLSWNFDSNFLKSEFKKYIALIKEKEKQENTKRENIQAIINAFREIAETPSAIQPLINVFQSMRKNGNKDALRLAADYLTGCLRLLYRSQPQKIAEEKTELKVIPKENKLEKMQPLSLQEYSDLTNDQLNAITSPEHYSYHVRNIYAAAIECEEIIPFNSIQFDLFKNKEWRNSIDQRLQVVYQTSVTDSTPIVLFMLANFFVGIGKIQGAIWILQFIQSQTSSVVVNSKLSELQTKTASLNKQLQSSPAGSMSSNPKKLETSIPVLKKALEHNPAILEKILPLFQKPPKPIPFLEQLISILKGSHSAIIALVLREYCFGYSHTNAIRATALPVPLLEGPGPRQKPTKKVKLPINEEKKTQLPKQNISSPIPQPVEIQLPPAALISNISSPPKAIKSKPKNPKAKKDRRDKNSVTEKKEDVSPSTNFQPIDSTIIMNQLFQMTAGGHKHKETKLNTNETKNVASQQMSPGKLLLLESSLLDFLPYISPITITKIQIFLDNVKAIGVTVYTYGSTQDHWLLRKTGNNPTFLPNDFDLKIDCRNLSPDQMQRIFIEVKRLIPEITQQKTDEYYDFIEGRMDEYHVCNITFEKAGYVKTQDPIVISDCQSQITSAGVKCDLNAYPGLKHNLEQKVFSIRPLTASSTTDELPAQSVLMRVVKKIHSTCQLSDLKPDESVSHLFSFKGAIQFFTNNDKTHLELSKLFDWVGKQIASRKKIFADFCKEGVGGLLPFMQAYIAYKSNKTLNDAIKVLAEELLRQIFATQNPENLFKYNRYFGGFPIDTLRTSMMARQDRLSLMQGPAYR